MVVVETATTPTFFSFLTRCRIPCACHAKRHLNIQKWSEHGVLCTFDLDMCFAPLRLHFFDISTYRWCVLYILTSTCASRQNSVNFVDISTSKSGPNMRCSVHFDMETCFAPERRALFRRLNFQKWSEHAVLCTF